MTPLCRGQWGEHGLLTVGALPKAVTRMVPKSAADRRLPGVAAVTTNGDDT